MKVQVENKNRIYYIDILRAISCIAVVMIHASANYVMKNFGDINFIVGDIIDSLFRFAVPIFLMISGSLLLDENYNYTEIKNKNRIIKMIQFFIFWSFLYMLIFTIIIPIKNGHRPNIKISIGTFGLGYYHLWFVYLIVGLYLLLPLLRLWIKDKNIRYVRYFIFLAIIFGFLLPQFVEIGSYFSNVFDNLQTILNYIGMDYVSGYLLYFILGWYLRFYEIKNKKIIYFLGIISIIFEISMTYFLSLHFNKAIQTYSNLSLNVLFQSMMVYIYIKDKYSKAKKNNTFINFISHYSLGIYAIHACIIDLTYMLLDKSDITSSLIGIPILFLVSFGISLLGSFMMNKTNLLKKFVS